MLLLMAGARHFACSLHFWVVLWCSFFPGNESKICCDAVSHSAPNSPTWHWGIIKVIRADGRRGSVELTWRSESPPTWAFCGGAGGVRGSDITSFTRKSHEREKACQPPNRLHTTVIPSRSARRLLHLRCFIVLCEATTYLSLTGKLNTNWENWMVRWWIEAWRAGCSRSQRPNRTSLCPSVCPSGVTGREGLLTEDVRGPKIKIMHHRNLEDNTQGHTKESNTIWKYKTHNPRADRGDTICLSDVLFFFFGHFCLYVKFRRFQMCSYTFPGAISADRLQSNCIKCHYWLNEWGEASLYSRHDLSHSVAWQDQL